MLSLGDPKAKLHHNKRTMRVRKTNLNARFRNARRGGSSKVRNELGQVREGMRRAGRLASVLCQGQRSFQCSFCFGSIFGCAGAAFTCSNLVLRRVGHVRFMFDRGFCLWSTRAGERAEGPRPRNAAFTNLRWQETPSKRVIQGRRIPGTQHCAGTKFKLGSFRKICDPSEGTRGEY